MLNTLKHFGFNESFINWVKTLYTDIQTCVMNNGWVSEMFTNTRGIRQGVLYQLCNNPEKDPKVSISLNAIYISSLDVQNKVVSSASCDILML
jgi:hypothetical protein